MLGFWDSKSHWNFQAATSFPTIFDFWRDFVWRVKTASELFPLPNFPPTEKYRSNKATSHSNIHKPSPSCLHNSEPTQKKISICFQLPQIILICFCFQETRCFTMSNFCKTLDPGPHDSIKFIEMARISPATFLSPTQVWPGVASGTRVAKT